MNFEVTCKLRKMRVLDFDTECRPMHYSEWRPESQITAYGWGWADANDVAYRVLDQEMLDEQRNLTDFLEAYDRADMVTGHYIIRHDLPLLNDHCIRLLGTTLPPKLVSDTKVHAVKVKGLGMSQENLSMELGIGADKHSMNGSLWRKANTLTPEGAKQAIIRVTSDVIQHRLLREEMLERGMLKPPRMWSP